ncbi:prion-inhibition and propagation-domain-containing protein [Dichotomopilus funicola]|uniref:Prion-inhibition and propagation-domain-containing protein n=1 Tax=Dichotomopilus funicola TaxID=1934379 RepID=A0AAN6V5B7_9PEZI|nr:prion-inhibition and propagation-domain-containing protein [Dichotomopilus funicola]
MEAAGLAVGIVGLYTTCRDCYGFFTTVKTAEVESSAHLREMVIQQSILKAWGFHWRIQNQDSSGPEHPDPTGQGQTKLHKYLLNNRFKAEGVFNTLSALADTLSNQEKLTKRYGIQLQPTQAIQDASQLTNNVQLTIQNTTIENIQPVIKEVKHRLSVLNKFKWALKDRDNFRKLISDLRSHSESLYRLCPENAFGSMNIYLTMDCLARQESPAGLKWTSKLATEHAEVDDGSSVRGGYVLLASAATLKASVNENRDRVDAVDDGTLPSIEEEQPKMWYLGKGLALFDGQVVYVEMRDYRGPPPELTPEQKQKIKRRRNRARPLKLSETGIPHHYNNAGITVDYEKSDSDETDDDEPIESVRPPDPKLRALIKNFFNTFHGENVMKSVYGLNIAGMIDHTEGEHKGHFSILYKLPGTIGLQSRQRPAENLKLRAPVTLKSLLGNKGRHGIRSTLGARFELARNLVRAVCLLHSSGWLHKNIRAESVMFFPEHVNALQEDRYEVKIEIDVSKPILMGYIFSRPDDIMTPTESASAPPIDNRMLSSTQMEMQRSQSKTTSIWEPDGPSDEAAPRLRSRTPSLKNIYGRDMLNKSTVSEPTKDINISGFTLDYYQHPAKHADPQRLYRHAYDVYSLGILLLEIGLWETLRNYDDFRSGYNMIPDYDDEYQYERRRWICREYLDRVRWACGDVYADVVLSCLMVDSMDDEVARVSERELCARLVAELEGCQA